MNKLKLAILAVFVSLVSFVGYNALLGDNSFAGTEQPECGPNAIITCGAISSSILKTKYAENKDGLQTIFTHYNISAADVAGSTNAKTGYVDVDGNVTVDGKVVATSAETVGRSASLGGSAVKIGNLTVYQGPDRLKSTLSAYVFFNADGTFKSAVLKVCGNPVKANPVPKPVYTCDLLTADKISRFEYKFTTKATANNGATITGYRYSFGDGTTANGSSTINHTYTATGTYAASVTVTFTVDGASKEATSTTCKTQVPIEQLPVTVCDLTTNTVVTIDKAVYDKDTTRYSTDTDACSKVTYCDTSTKKIVTVAKNDKQSTYTTNLDECNTTVCRVSDKATITIRDEEYQRHKDSYTTDMTKCQPVVTPVSTELPKTGPEELLGGGVGAGALVLAGYHYYASRKLI